MVKWSVFSPSTSTIGVRFLLKSTIFMLNCCWKERKKTKELFGLAHFNTKTMRVNCFRPFFKKQYKSMTKARSSTWNWNRSNSWPSSIEFDYWFVLRDLKEAASANNLLRGRRNVIDLVIYNSLSAEVLFIATRLCPMTIIPHAMELLTFLDISS